MSTNDLKKAGLKVTGPRVKILNFLENNQDQHLSAEAIYKAMLDQGDEIGLATIYRVLTQFETAGIVNRHHFEGEHCVFELDTGEHHDHIVCIECGKVEEFVDDVIEQRQEQIAKGHGFKLTEHALNLYGVCANCQTA